MPVRFKSKKEMERYIKIKPTSPKPKKTKPTTKEPLTSEHEEQARVMAWAKVNTNTYPALVLLHSIPNGGFRAKTTASWMKREGQLAGMPDLCLPVPHIDASGNVWHSLYIEMKRMDGRLSDSQTAIISKLRQYQNKVVVCFGAEAAIAALQEYLT